MRIRDIIHRSGARLRLVLEQPCFGTPPLVRLLGAEGGTGAILLDLVAADLLSGYLMSARLAADGQLSPERIHGERPLHLRLVNLGEIAAIELRQEGERLTVVQPLWDRLYAELLLVLAHGRHRSALAPAAGPAAFVSRRSLH